MTLIFACLLVKMFKGGQRKITQGQIICFLSNGLKCIPQIKFCTTYSIFFAFKIVCNFSKCEEKCVKQFIIYILFVYVVTNIQISEFIQQFGNLQNSHFNEIYKLQGELIISIYKNVYKLKFIKKKWRKISFYFFFATLSF